VPGYNTPDKLNTFAWRDKDPYILTDRRLYGQSLNKFGLIQ
jgi:hypothetical protein